MQPDRQLPCSRPEWWFGRTKTIFAVLTLTLTKDRRCWHPTNRARWTRTSQDFRGRNIHIRHQVLQCPNPLSVTAARIPGCRRPLCGTHLGQLTVHRGLTCSHRNNNGSKTRPCPSPPTPRRATTTASIRPGWPWIQMRPFPAGEVASRCQHPFRICRRLPPFSGALVRWAQTMANRDQGIWGSVNRG